MWTVRFRIVLRNAQARAELPARSRRRIAASRIEAHRAGAVALQAVEHTDPDAVVGGPVRGGAAGYPHGRLQVVGQLPVAGAFVADRLDWLCSDGGCRGHLHCSDPLFGRRLRAGAPQGRGEVEPVRVAAGAYHNPLGQFRPGKSSHRVGAARAVDPIHLEITRMVGHRSRRDREETGSGARCRTSATAAAARVRVSTVSMLMESVTSWR